MFSKITRGYKAMLEAANAKVRSITAAEALSLHASGDVIFVDLRDPRELAREGKVPEAFPCTRGMLEFWIDPESPYAKPVFQQDKTFVFYCASGWRSALAAATAQEMGLSPVCHIAGGFTAWKEAGGSIEAVEAKSKA